MKIITQNGKEFSFDNEFKYMLVDNNDKVMEESILPYTMNEVLGLEEIHARELTQVVMEVE